MVVPFLCEKRPIANVPYGEVGVRKVGVVETED